MDAERNREVKLNAATLLSPANVLEPFRAVFATPRPGATELRRLLARRRAGLPLRLPGDLPEPRGRAVAGAGGQPVLLHPGSQHRRPRPHRLGCRPAGVRHSHADVAGRELRRVDDHDCGDHRFLVAAADPARIAGLSGLAVGSWNGVYLAEVASHAAPGKVSEATAGSTFLTFLGYVFGPVLFSIAVQTTGIYAPAFIAAGILPIVAGLTLIRVR